MKKISPILIVLVLAVIGIVILVKRRLPEDEPAPDVTGGPNGSTGNGTTTGAVDCTLLLQKGMYNSPEVSALQISINRIIRASGWDNDYQLQVDGDFGPKTEASLVYLLDTMGRTVTKRIRLNEFPDTFICQ